VLRPSFWCAEIKIQIPSSASGAVTYVVAYVTLVLPWCYMLLCIQIFEVSGRYLRIYTLRRFIYVHILVVLFYDAFSVTRLYSVDGRISEWWWSWNDLVGSGSGLILSYCPVIRLEGLSKSTKTLIRVARAVNRTRDLPIWTRIFNHTTTTLGVYTFCKRSYMPIIY
jgi:hypothetical protein